MKRLKYIILLFMLGQMTLSNVQAQIDTVFWFAAPWVSPDHDGNTQLAFRISSFATPSTVRLQLPSQDFPYQVLLLGWKLGVLQIVFLTFG